MDITIDALFLFFSIFVSYVFGRLSLRKGKYTGWYERFLDHAELIFMIQNAVIFFTSSLYLMLLLFSTDLNDLKPFIPVGISVMLVLFLVIILIILLNNRSTRGASLPRSRKGLTTQGTIDDFSISENPEHRESTSHDDSGTQPKKLLLRFLSVFSLVLGLCLLVFPVGLLICYSLQNTSNSLYDLIIHSYSFVVNAHDCLCFLLAFLLMLTSSTGLIMSAKIIRISSTYPVPGPTGEDRKRVDLQKRIRNRV